jgi:hypothetical protein
MSRYSHWAPEDGDAGDALAHSGDHLVRRRVVGELGLAHDLLESLHAHLVSCCGEMSWSWERPVYGTVSHPAGTIAANMTAAIEDHDREISHARILPDGRIPQHDLGRHDRLGSRPARFELDADRRDLRGRARGSAAGVEIGQGEAPHALGNGLSTAPRVATKGALAGAKEIGHPLVRRIDHPVAVEIALEDDAGGSATTTASMPADAGS